MQPISVQSDKDLANLSPPSERNEKRKKTNGKGKTLRKYQNKVAPTSRPHANYELRG